MNSPVWLGIDVGTQSVRTLAVTAEGTVLSKATAPLQSTRDGVRHEQNPEQWWAALRHTTAQVTAQVDGRPVAGVAIDATSGTILLGDATMRALTPALMYDDARAVAEVEPVDEYGAAVWQELGYQRMQPSWALPKLVWLCRYYPDVATRATTRLYHQADLLSSRLVGRPVAADASHALKTGYHLIEEHWPDEVMARLGVPRALLPDVVRPGTVLGVVGRLPSADTGIPAGTPVVAGMTDGCAAQLGAGALSVGAYNSVLGTTLVLKGVALRPVHDPNGVVYCHRGPGGTWLPGGASSSGAGVISRHFAGQDLVALTASAAQLPPDVIAYPLVSPGERFPFRAPDAEPFVLGEPTSYAALFGGFLLGLACVERLCFDYLDLLGAPGDGALSFTGGASRNRFWSQLRVDLLGRPARLPSQAEPALGMAILAASADGPSLDVLAGRMISGGEELSPDTAKAPQLLEAYLRFVDELVERGWLSDVVTQHARSRVTA